MKLTKITIKALNILNLEYGKAITANEFAKRMWPDSEGWKMVKNTGHGATRGKGMWLAGGSYLAKLRNRGFVTIDEAVLFRLSFEGIRALRNAEDKNK